MKTSADPPPRPRAPAARLKRHAVLRRLWRAPFVAAGVEGGDVLRAIDGRPASEFTLDEIRRLFRLHGREYALELRRGERSVRVTLRLRRVI